MPYPLTVAKSPGGHDWWEWTDLDSPISQCGTVARWEALDLDHHPGHIHGDDAKRETAENARR